MSHTHERILKLRSHKKYKPMFGLCSCGKRGYNNSGDAAAAALSASGAKGKPFRLYKCSLTESGKWHITSKPARPTAEGS